MITSLSVKTHLAGMTSFLLVAASLLGFSSLMPTAAASPSIDGTTTNVTTTTTAAEGTNATATTIIELSQEPLAVGHYRIVSEDMTDETQPQFTFEGNTTITLPNSTETIITQDTGEGTSSILSGDNAGSLRGHIHMTTEDGSETATADFTEFFTFESSTGIGLAYFSTNSTGMLASLNNMIAVFLDEEQSIEDEEVRVTFFEWKGGNGGASSVPSSDNNSTAAVPAAAAGG